MARPLSAGHAAMTVALAELSRDIVYLLVERERIVADPFTAALRSYRVLGDPIEVGGRWRQQLVRDSELDVVRRLGRDLLYTVAPVVSGRTLAIPAVAASAAKAAIPVWPSTVVFAGPFDRAEQLDTLTDALVMLPGVLYASVVLVDEGMARVQVTHAGAVQSRAMLARVIDLAATVIAGTPPPAVRARTGERAA